MYQERVYFTVLILGIIDRELLSVISFVSLHTCTDVLIVKKQQFIIFYSRTILLDRQGLVLGQTKDNKGQIAHDRVNNERYL